VYPHGPATPASHPPLHLLLPRRARSRISAPSPAVILAVFAAHVATFAIGVATFAIGVATFAIGVATFAVFATVLPRITCHPPRNSP